MQLLVGRCFQRNGVHIVPQVTHAEIILLRKRQKEQSHLFLQGGFTAWRSKAGSASREVWGFPLPLLLGSLLVQRRGRQAMRYQLSASPRYGIHHSDSPWPRAAWKKHPQHVVPTCWHASAPVPKPCCNHCAAPP